MIEFTYAALDDKGQLVEGKVQAENRDAAIAAVQARNSLLLSISEPAKGAAKAGARGSVPVWELIFLAEQLATLLESGLPLLRALTLQESQTKNPRLAAALAGASRSLSAGKSLADCLAAEKEVFPNLWPSLVRVGEMSGTLPRMLTQIAAYHESQEEISSRVTTALLYPCILAGLSMAVLAFFVVRIVPSFAEIFDSFDAKLPLITQLILDFSVGFQKHFAVIMGGALAAGLLLRGWLATDAAKRLVDRWSRRAPVVGDFLTAVHFQRFVATLSMMLTGGVEIVRAMDVLGDVFAGQPDLRDALAQARSSILGGATISASLGKSGSFPSLVVEMARTGEESGKLPEVLTATNRYYLKRMDQFLRRFSAVIDPILVVAVGGIVVVIVMAIMLPVMSLTKLH